MALHAQDGALQHAVGYTRMDLRLTPEGEVDVLAANPNPQLAHGKDFPESAERAG